MQRSAVSTAMPRALLKRRNALIVSSASGVLFFAAGVYINADFPRIAGNDVSSIVAMALICLAPFTGLPSALIGPKDLSRIRQGIIPSSLWRATWWAWIVGVGGTVGNTILLLLFFLQVLSITGPGHAKIAMMADLNTLIEMARDYRVRPAEAHGGAGSFSGFAINPGFSRGEDGSYSARVLHPDTIQFTATWRGDTGSAIIVKVGPDGRSAEYWIFRGLFKD